MPTDQTETQTSNDATGAASTIVGTVSPQSPQITEQMARVILWQLSGIEATFEELRTYFARELAVASGTPLEEVKRLVELNHAAQQEKRFQVLLRMAESGSHPESV